ncbi:MAG: hypothetical protein ACRERU_21885 [Methylococcales bacterium]
MLEAISLTGSDYRMGYAALNLYAQTGSAISAEAQVIEHAAFDIIHTVERSQSLFGKKTAVFSELWKLADNCREKDWDADGASALEPAAIQNAVRFIRAFPDGLPLPELSPEPDGSISLDWIVSRHRLFSISIGVSNRLVYAWLDGSDTGHGVARFDGTTIPVRILDGIRAIFSV